MKYSQVRARLIERDSNLRQFAIANDYNPRTVQIVAQRYIGTGKLPRGVISYQILRDLSLAVGEPVVDGLEALVA